jgi:copper chaperone NosL
MKMKPSSRLLLVLGSVALAVSIFVPIWRIELDAPQYPEGLALLIYADKLGGDVEIINGLNHYIGMATLHTENFIEFTVLPWIIGIFAAGSLLTALAGRTKILYLLLGIFILFGIIAMIDFWRWEYNYGHNLDPKAAIVVPGMAYQPPLIGFKQLLNFGAYSIPDKGGWMFIGAGLLMVVAVLSERGVFLRLFRSRGPGAGTAAATLVIMLTGCGTAQPEAIRLHSDMCASCRMSISDGRFGAELVTEKGRVYKFDDLSCLLAFRKKNTEMSFSHILAHDYSKSNELIDAEPARYVMSEFLNSPMRGNMAAFADEESAQRVADSLSTKVLDWNFITNALP